MDGLHVGTTENSLSTGATSHEDLIAVNRYLAINQRPQKPCQGPRTSKKDHDVSKRIRVRMFF